MVAVAYKRVSEDYSERFEMGACVCCQKLNASEFRRVSIICI